MKTREQTTSHSDLTHNSYQAGYLYSLNSSAWYLFGAIKYGNSHFRSQFAALTTSTIYKDRHPDAFQEVVDLYVEEVRIVQQQYQVAR